jgi:hypothetical protein
MAGGCCIYPNQYIKMIKYDKNGNRDLTFGGDGELEIDATPDIDWFVDIYSDANDNVFLTENAYPNLDGPRRFILIKLNSSGQRVSDFGQNGVLEMNVTCTKTEDAACMIQNLPLFVKSVNQSGKIILEGKIHYPKNQNWGYIRLNSNGSPDVSFGENGKFIFSETVPPDGSTVGPVFSGEKFYLVRNFYKLPELGSYLERRNLNGSLDSSGPNPTQKLEFFAESTPNTIGILSSSRLVIGISSSRVSTIVDSSEIRFSTGSDFIFFGRLP